MATLTTEQLKKEIEGILKGSDLTEMTAKKVRQRLEEKYETNFSDRKEEIDDLVMNYVDSQDIDESEEEEESDAETKPKAAPKRKPTKRGRASSEEEDGSEASEKSEDDDDDDDETYNSKKPVPKKKAKSKSKGSESDSDSDWGKKQKKQKKAAAGGGGGGGRGKGSGYTKALKLSPELAHLMGSQSMARHEVVKRMWALIKERNLYDPNNKQYAICDSDLYTVIGVKRFRTFGMMKYLKTHFRT